FYNLPDLTHYRSEGIKGQGSEDFQSFPMFCQTSAKNSLYIWGYTPLNIKKYIVSEYGDVNYEREFTLTLRESFNQMHIIRDSLLVYSAIPSEFSIKKYDLIQNEYIGEIQLKKDNHPESFFYSNRGVIAANDSLILYAYVYKKEIDIYDLETMKLKTKIVGDYKPQYIVVGDFEANIHHYIRIVAGKKYVYALHAETNNLNQDKTSLEVYDFHWNPVIRYTFDIVPYLFEIDEENGFIIGHNNEYEDYFLRYKI
ncbi:MAG: TolB-like 6-bladed beta-propeller domain-containing protein, partial [Tannerellaceae bacterium]|nr:TolB-like 6-bladed beta-propeller domain-containing protein [Tannerellaceae bacterium]